MAQDGGLQLVAYELTGVAGSGLLLHNPAGMSRAPEEATIGRKIIPTPEEEAEAGAYRMPSGQLYLPSIHVRAAILGAASGMKIEKKPARQILSAGLFTLSEYCPLFDPETGDALKEYEIDIRRAVVQRQGIRRARPKLPRWACEIEFQFDTLLLNPKIIKDVLDLAGRIVGVGDYRPSKGGPFGRFMAEQIKR